MLGLIPFLPMLLKANAVVITDARVGLVLMAAWAMVRTPFVVNTMSIVALQDMGMRNLIGTAAMIVRLGLSVLLVWKGLGLTGLMIAFVSGEVCDTEIGRAHV